MKVDLITMPSLCPMLCEPKPDAHSLESSTKLTCEFLLWKVSLCSPPLSCYVTPGLELTGFACMVHLLLLLMYTEDFKCWAVRLHPDHYSKIFYHLRKVYQMYS